MHDVTKPNHQEGLVRLAPRCAASTSEVADLRGSAVEYFSFLRDRRGDEGMGGVQWGRSGGGMSGTDDVELLDDLEFKLWIALVVMEMNVFTLLRVLLYE